MLTLNKIKRIMNVEKLRKKTLTELIELMSATEAMCESYAKDLTNYATMSADPQFQRMDIDTQHLYNERGKFVSLLNVLRNIIKEKLFEIYDE